MCAFNRDKKRSWSAANEDDSIQPESSFEQIILHRHHGSSSRELDFLALESPGDIGFDRAGLVPDSALVVDDSGDLGGLPQAYEFISYEESQLSNSHSSTLLGPFNDRAGDLALSLQSPLISNDPVSDSCTTFSTELTSNPTPTSLRDTFVEVCYGTVSMTQLTYQSLY
jgi:hypothetical protein